MTFCQKNIGTKAARKMLMKLTTGLQLSSPTNPNTPLTPSAHTQLLIDLHADLDVLGQRSQTRGPREVPMWPVNI